MGAFVNGGSDFAGIGVDDHGGLILHRPGGVVAGGLLELVTVTIHGQDADVVRGPVKQRAGQTL